MEKLPASAWLWICKKCGHPLGNHTDRRDGQIVAAQGCYHINRILDRKSYYREEECKCTGYTLE